jgi:hypothetical protein
VRGEKQTTQSLTNFASSIRFPRAKPVVHANGIICEER